METTISFIDLHYILQYRRRILRRGFPSTTHRHPDILRRSYRRVLPSFPHRRRKLTTYQTEQPISSMASRMLPYPLVSSTRNDRYLESSTTPSWTSYIQVQKASDHTSP